MQNQYRRKGFNRVFGIVCAIALLFTAIYVPFTVSAAGTAPSVEIKDNEAYVFDFSSALPTGDENKAAATAENGIGYYGWGWGTKNYTEGETSNTVLQAANASGKYWGTSGAFRLHTKLADGNYGIYALEPNTRYVVSFKIRVMSSPVTVENSKETNKSYTNLVYDVSFDPKADGQENNYINRAGTTAKKIYESLIDSNVFTLYDTNGNGTTYACSEDWLTATYFITTPAEFKKDNALAFYTTNYHGTKVEFDDVSVTKIGADSGIILLKDEYSATDELFFGKEGEKIDLNSKDISDRAKNPSHTFEGWYADAGRTEKITEVAFSKTEDKVVYSRWNAPVTVTFKDTLNGTESKVTGMAGEKFAYPEDPTDPDGKVWFMGWYKDEGCTVAHLVPQFGYADETLYTYWKGEVPGLTQDFENYTTDKWTDLVVTRDNGTKDDKSDDYTLTYKSNYLMFYTTMSKQSDVVAGGNNAIKFHWNTDPTLNKDVSSATAYNAQNPESYEHSRYSSYDNLFYLGKGIESNQIYNVSFKYNVEQADQSVKFYLVTAAGNNSWGGRKTYVDSNNVSLTKTKGWQEYTFTINVGDMGTNNSLYLGITLTENEDVIMYFDDVKVEAFAQPYESVITLNTNIDGKVINFKGKRGEKIEWPEMTHPENAPFNGYYLDKNFTEKYESEVFERLPVTVYAQWLSYSGFTQDFENYTTDAWQNYAVKKDNGTKEDKTDDYTLTYKSNYLVFYTTMSKQSEVVNSGNNAVKFHWNTDPALNKDVSSATAYNAQNPESYEQSRYSADDNLFYLGKGLEENQYYDVTFKYKVEKGNQDATFYICTANPTNSWGSRATHRAPENVSIKKTDGWVEYSFSFTTGAIGGYNAAFLGVKLTKNDDVIMYFDDVKVKSLANSAEVVMFLETGTSLGKVNHVGKRGEALNLPTLTHADDAEFLGWYLDASCTTPFESDVYPVANTTLYAKWAPYAMTFKAYPYGGGAGPYSDPNISVVHQKGVGNGDDYAMRFYVNRKVDNDSDKGTSQAIQIAAGIEDGAVYRIKYDYKSTSIQSSAAQLVVATGYPENIWVSPSYNKYNHTTVILPQGGTNGWKSAEFIIRAGVKTDGSHLGDALFLRYNANIYKAGDKIDSYIDNVWVEKIDAPYVFFDGQNGGTPGFANGKAGEEIKAPATPIRVGYTFDGWYLEPECENKYEATTFEEEMALTVYAKWKQSNTYIYSFENYSYKDDTVWTFVGGERIPNAKKTGTYGVRFGNRDPEKYAMSVFMLEDGGEYYKIEKGRCYILTLNYKINKVGPTNLMVGWIASAYGNFYVGSNTGKTTLAPTMQITTDQGKEMKGKWMQQTFVLDAMKLEDAAGHVHDQLFGYFKNDQGWDIYVDDVTVTAVPKGQVAVGFYAEGAKGLPKYVVGKPGQSYASKVPEVLEKENMKFKGYFTKGADGAFTEKTRGNMVFGEIAETLYARFLNWERTQNFDDGFYEAAYSSGFGYTIHDFDYEVYDSEKEGNSKDNVTSGRYSLHRKGDSMFNENSIVLTLDKNIAEGERYTVSMKVKLGKHFHTDGAVKVVSSRSFKYAWTTTGDYYPVVPIAELKEGEWVEVSYTFNSVESFISLQTPGYVELFIDDIKFTLVDEKTPLSEPKEYTEYVAAERDADGKLLYKDRTAVDISSIIDESLGAKSFPWIYVGIGAGALVLVAVVLVLVLVVFKKKKNA